MELGSARGAVLARHRGGAGAGCHDRGAVFTIRGPERGRGGSRTRGEGTVEESEGMDEGVGA